MEKYASATLARRPITVETIVEAVEKTQVDLPRPRPTSGDARRPLPAQRVPGGRQRGPCEYHHDFRRAACSLWSRGQSRSVFVFEKARAVVRSKLQTIAHREVVRTRTRARSEGDGGDRFL